MRLLVAIVKQAFLLVIKSGNDNLQFNKAALSADKKKLNYVFDGDKYEVEVEKLRGHFLETVKRLPIDKRPAYVEFTENVIDKASGR